MCTALQNGMTTSEQDKELNAPECSSTVYSPMETTSSVLLDILEEIHLGKFQTEIKNLNCRQCSNLTQRI